ncbi:MAG: VWA domain-containing protein, partial [Anaerolineae bacterium]
PTATLTTAADRANYEAVIGYFADAVYEESNGANRLRKVTFYRDAMNFDSANVRWVASCHPNANASGYIVPGWHVNMCDQFYSTNFLDPAKQADGGGTLAHEWGHYFYGMYDEYRGSTVSDRISSPQATDPGTSVAIMNSQWGGFNNLNKLNFSSPASNFQIVSAQGRVYGADAWAVLSRPKNEDPQNTYAERRPYWPELAAAAPPAGTTQIDLPSAEAREQLEIVWEPGFTPQAVPDGASAFTVTAVNNVIREIVIDRSTSMVDSGYLDEAKSAVAALIEQSAVGDTIGIIAFDSTVTEIYPLTDITDDTVKNALITAVYGITAGDANVAGGDALQSALDALIDPLVPNVAAQAVYYITAGSPNSGINATTVVPDYQDNGISLHIFGFDPTDGDEANLRLLSDLTEGEYTTVQDVTDLQKALRIIDQDTSQTQDVTLAYDYADVVAGDVYSYTIAVDETLTDIDFEFIYFSEADAVYIDLEEPDGYVWYIDPAADCETYDSGTPDVETSCYIGFLTPAVGNWTVYAYANETVNEDFYIIDIETGVAAAGATTYDAVVNAVDSDVVEYPRPIVVEASVSRDFPIAGLNTRGWLFSPDGNLTYINFRDDGVAPDLLPDDGTYSAYVDYAQNGEHWVTVHFDNYAGQAFYTDGNLDYL